MYRFLTAYCLEFSCLYFLLTTGCILTLIGSFQVEISLLLYFWNCENDLSKYEFLFFMTFNLMHEKIFKSTWTMFDIVQIDFLSKSVFRNHCSADQCWSAIKKWPVNVLQKVFFFNILCCAYFTTFSIEDNFFGK